MFENGDPEAAKSKVRILFVEDEATLRDHLAEKLSDEYVVDTAGNGNEALLAVIRAKPALVVSDIVMPDMDGVELLKTLRQSPGTRGIPVLLISGRAADEYRIEGFEQGADGFLAKPYTERELRALIGSMLRSARLRADFAVRQARDQLEEHTAVERATSRRTLAELRSCEEQLLQNQLELTSLREAHRRKNEILARLERQLREHLAPVGNGVNILRLRSAADDVSQQTIDMLSRRVSQLVLLANDLLEASRI